MMGTRHLRTVVALLILSGCAAAVPDSKVPPEGLAWSPTGPFSGQNKTALPADARGVAHYVIGSMLMTEGDYDGALKEFETAAQANPTDGFLHYRLATLYLRRGDLKKAVTEAEAAVRLDPQSVDNHLLLAGL